MIHITLILNKHFKENQQLYKSFFIDFNMSEEKTTLIPQLKWWEHQEEIKGLKTIPANNGFDMIDVFQEKPKYAKIDTQDRFMGHIPKPDYRRIN